MGNLINHKSGLLKVINISFERMSVICRNTFTIIQSL